MDNVSDNARVKVLKGKGIVGKSGTVTSLNVKIDGQTGVKALDFDSVEALVVTPPPVDPPSGPVERLPRALLDKHMSMRHELAVDMNPGFDQATGAVKRDDFASGHYLLPWTTAIPASGGNTGPEIYLTLEQWIRSNDSWRRTHYGTPGTGGNWGDWFKTWDTFTLTGAPAGNSIGLSNGASKIKLTIASVCHHGAVGQRLPMGTVQGGITVARMWAPADTNVVVMAGADITSSSGAGGTGDPGNLGDQGISAGIRVLGRPRVVTMSFGDLGPDNQLPTPTGVLSNAEYA